MFVQSPPIAYRLGVEAGLSSVGGKPWADDACLAGLVRAIDDLLQPQAYLCSMGADRRLQQTGLFFYPRMLYFAQTPFRGDAGPGAEE